MFILYYPYEWRQTHKDMKKASVFKYHFWQDNYGLTIAWGYDEKDGMNRSLLVHIFETVK